jgi:hypothetical protein
MRREDIGNSMGALCNYCREIQNGFGKKEKKTKQKQMKQKSIFLVRSMDKVWAPSLCPAFSCNL